MPNFVMISDSIDIEKVKVLVNNLHSSEEEDGEESTVKLPKTFEERKQLGMASVARSIRDIIWLRVQLKYQRHLKKGNS